MTRRLFLAGASGAIGRRLAPLLIADGWQVIGSTRSPEKAQLLREIGVEPVVVDVFDADALRGVMADARPEIVIHQLTDLPHALDPRKMVEALVRNARLRDEGTRNLVAAAVHAGAKRLIAQSIAFVYADGPLPHREEDRLLSETDPVYGETSRAVASLERQVLGASLDEIVLRYGLFYGPGTGFDAPIAPRVRAYRRRREGRRTGDHQGGDRHLQRRRARWAGLEREGCSGPWVGCRLEGGCVRFEWRQRMHVDCRHKAGHDGGAKPSTTSPLLQKKRVRLRRRRKTKVALLEGRAVFRTTLRRCPLVS